MRRKAKNIAVGLIVASALVMAIGAPALAWHPSGVITKSVQNVTAGGELMDANDAASAVSVKPGDTLRYVITVNNKGAANDKGSNDMANTVMTDTLPDGVELASNPAQRSITENLGTIKPQQAVTKSYLVKVTSQTNGAVIENKACFTGNSIVNDSPQKGCDTANTKITVETPATPLAPTPAPTPTPTPTPPAPAAPTTAAPEQSPLPATGPESLLGALTGAALVSYAAVAAVRSRQLVRKQYLG